MDVTETISLIELAWTAPATVGLLFTSWMLIDIWRDRRAVVRGGWNGLARLQADRWLRSEAIVALIHLIFTGVGVFAMTQPAARSSSTVPLIGLMLTAMFVAVPTLLVVRSVGDRLVRRAIRRQFEWQEQEGAIMSNWDKAGYAGLMVAQAMVTAAAIQIAAGQVPVPAAWAWALPIVQAGLVTLAMLLPSARRANP